MLHFIELPVLFKNDDEVKNRIEEMIKESNQKR